MGLVKENDTITVIIIITAEQIRLNETNRLSKVFALEVTKL